MRFSARATILVTLAAFPPAPGPALAREGRRIFVSVDMEGIAGVVSGEQLAPQAFDYAAFRELMTQEANAAIAAAREAGASEFVVADSHGNFQNLLPDKLPPDVELVRGGPRPQGMLQGLDASFDGVIFVGYHASTVNPAGVRAHSFSSANLADVRVNGVSVTEGSWNAAIAAHYGVPVLAVTGDEAAVAEVQARVPGVVGAVVKWPYAFHAARTLSPTAARAVIGEAVRKGMARRGSTDLPRAASPIRLEIRFKSYRPAEALSWLPGAERADAHAVRYTVKDMPEASRFLAFVLAYQADLQP
ncbi:MAG TPA: M55 family metallopeptidase [Vicinamibacteria bacterium]|jgi:D-amino peptidase